MRSLPRWPRRPIRIVLIEDTRKLRCSAPNLVALRTKDGVASLSDFVRSPLRPRLDRIPVGEVRCAEALDLQGPGAPAIQAAAATSLSASSLAMSRGPFG